MTITRCVHRMPVFAGHRIFLTLDREKLFAGNNTLRALSQTSRLLRSIFLPVLWERVHACFTPWNQPLDPITRIVVEVSTDILMRRMVGIQKTPYILPYIRSLTVTLVECRSGNWAPMEEFVRILDLLPNLKDLTMLMPQPDMITLLSISCRHKVFPSVVRLALDNCLAPIIHCFPNLQTFTFVWRREFEDVFPAIQAHCPHIHTINNFSLCPPTVKCLRDAIPNVRRLSLWDPPSSDFCLLEDMDALSELRIYRTMPLNEPQEIVGAAERVLCTSKAVGRKKLRIYLPEETSINVFWG
ncbi:hypothetical protein MSAN_00063500 [Mycena sanguinolenta]|uniref:Uncharacterized protein n=1 Tax=Mycena sanguinolenta TaxID=230812 RepID=A0A8H6ZCL3_9AGAR|nr:hypothetical protein MSAN_00063500 [Mycena sanguinolenta]